MKQDLAAQDLAAQNESYLFSVIGEPHRLAILRLLLSGSRNVGQIGDGLQIEATLLSKHLRVLRESKIIISEKIGRSVFYSIAPNCRAGDGEKLELFCCRIDLKPSISPSCLTQDSLARS